VYGCRKKKGQFYQDNKSLPVFEWNARTYNVSEIIGILLNTAASSNMVCFCTPNNVQHNCTFLVDQTKLKNVADLRADDSGSWKNNGVQCVIVAVTEEEVSIAAREKRCQITDYGPGPISANSYIFYSSSVS